MEKLLLTVTMQDRVLRQYVFEARSVTIGRVCVSDVVLDNPTVSRLHAEISYECGCFYINDLGSANGSILNGTSVTREPLHDGDVLGIGRFTLTVALQPQDAAPSFISTLHEQGATIRFRD